MRIQKNIPLFKEGIYPQKTFEAILGFFFAEMCSNEENLPLLGGKDGSDITMNTKQLEHVSISASRSSRKRLLRSAAVPSKILPQSSPNLIKACLLLVCVSIISVLIHYQQHYQQNRSHSIRDPFTPSAPAQKLTRLEQLLHHWPVVDTHNDFPGKIRWFLGKLSAKNITQLGPEFNTDIVRLKKVFLNDTMSLYPTHNFKRVGLEDSSGLHSFHAVAIFTCKLKMCSKLW